MKKFRAMMVILAVFVLAAMIIPNISAQEYPDDRFGWLECDNAPGLIDLDISRTYLTGYAFVNRCWLDGNFAGASVWVDFHNDDEFDPLNDDPDEQFVISMGVDDGGDEYTVFYYDRSDDIDLDEAVELSNGNYQLVSALGGAAALYYLPGSGEYQINYIAPGSSVVRVMRMFRASNGEYFVSSIDSFILPDIPEPVVEEEEE